MKISFSMYVGLLIAVSTNIYCAFPEGLNLFQILYTLYDKADVTLSILDDFTYDTSISLSTIEKIVEELNFENNAIPHISSISDALSDALVQLSGDVANVQTTVNTVNSTVGNVQGAISTINTNVNQILNGQNDDDSLLLSVSDALTTKLVDVDDDIATLQTTANSISSDVSRAQTTANAINNAVSTVNSMVNTIHSTANTISSGVSGVQTAANAINNAVSTVNSTVNTISTNVNTVLTELAEEGELLISVSDVLTDTIMNLDLGTTSLFGDSINELHRDYIALQFYYGVPSLDTTTTLANTGSVVTTDSVVFVSTGTNATGSAKLSSKHVAQCKPGHEVYAVFSAIFPQGPIANATQWIGLFDSVDGLAVGFNGTSFGLLYRNNSVDTVITQSNFNVDTIDGSGASGFNLNKTKLNAFRIAYGWYGTSIIRFQVLDSTGSWITFHEIINMNSGTVANFSNPCLPMCAQVMNSGNTSDVRIGTTAWRAGGIESGEGKAGVRVFSAERLESVLSISENYMFTIRSRTTFNSKPNKVKVRIVGFGGGNASDITPTILRYYKNATLAGSPSFSNVNTDSSVIEIDTAASSVSGGALLWAYGDAGLSFEYLSEDAVEFILLPGDSISVTAHKLLSLTSLSLYAVLTWEEYH